MFAYADLPVRPELVDVNRAVWEHVAAPGTWFDGAERVAIAAASRTAPSCAFCAERKAALSPMAVEGEHDLAEGHPLAAPLVDAVHRIVTDPSRLTARWVDGLREQGITPARHVELLSVALAVFGIDSFHRALGLELAPLPEPRAGEPTRHEPEGLTTGEAWVPLMQERRAAAEHRDLFAALPQTPNILRALTAVPSEARQQHAMEDAYYIPARRGVDLADNAGRALSRPQMELMAATVSTLNECFY